MPRHQLVPLDETAGQKGSQAVQVLFRLLLCGEQRAAEADKGEVEQKVEGGNILSIDAGNRKNWDDLKRRGYTEGSCCANCKHVGRSYFRDRVGCKLLDWTYGDDVIPTHICIEFEYKEIEKEQ